MSQYAIQTVNCAKTYKNGTTVNNVFTDLNLNIPRSCIYALLGASGCGKTTLLRCILGRLDLTKGRILVYGYSPGTKESGIPGSKVGYMPQEVALCEMLTIGETLQYYGRLVGLSDKEIRCRTDYFIKYLHMPPKHTQNKNLSGGQQRRVSFVVATMHKPQLIILDEPTVGIDPIVKNSMLNFLTSLVSEYHCTIVLTTHYIEEARKIATRVGMLRNGQLVVDDTPDSVITRFNAESLEDVFLKLCLGHEDFADKTTTSGGTTDSQYRPLLNDGSVLEHRDNYGNRKTNDMNESIQQSILDEFRLPNMRRVLATTWKNFLRLRRFPGALLFLFVFPVFQFSNGCFALGGYIQNIELGIFNEDSGKLGGQFLESFKSGVVKQEACQSYDICHRAMMSGKTYGLIHIPPNFTDALLDRIIESPIYSNGSVLSSTINVLFDNSDYIIFKTLEIDVMKTLQEFYRNAIFELGYSREAANHILNIHEHDAMWLNQPYRVYMVPPFLIITCFSAQVMVAVIFLFMEKVNGYLERAFIAGSTTVEVILSFVVLQFVVITGQVIGVLIMAFLVFKTPLFGSIFLVMWLAFLSGINGMSLGLVISALFTNILALCSMAIIFAFVVLAVAAAFWPIEAMPYALQYISMALPFYWPAKAMNDIMYRGFTLYDPYVLLGFAESFVWSMCLLVLTSVFFRTKR